MSRISVEQKITWTVRVDGRTVSEHANLQEAMDRKAQFELEERRFAEFLAKAKAEVGTWPEWKRNILGPISK